MSNNETMNVKRENLLNAYKNANDEQKAFLENLFGTETFTPKDIRERIKTFADALHELGNENPLVLAYQNTNLRDSDVASNNKDIIAYLKLRIIVAALNEGWEPQFIPGECRWAPYFVLYTKEEIDEMDEETKARVVFGRATMRVRMAVRRVRVRLRITMPRTCTRVSVLGLPSSLRNWQSMQELNLSTSLPTSCSVGN